MQLKISFKEIKQILKISSPDLPKYVSPLLNLANQFAQGTRPKVVGKMSQLMHDFTGRSVREWEEYYAEKQPEASRSN